MVPIGRLAALFIPIGPLFQLQYGIPFIKAVSRAAEKCSGSQNVFAYSHKSLKVQVRTFFNDIAEYLNSVTIFKFCLVTQSL